MSVTAGRTHYKIGGNNRDLTCSSSSFIIMAGVTWGPSVQPYGEVFVAPDLRSRSLGAVAYRVPERGMSFQSNFADPIAQPSAYYADPSKQPAIMQPVVGSSSGTDWTWYMEVYSHQRRVLSSQIRQCRLARSPGSVEAQIHDLLAGSLSMLFDCPP